MASDKNAEYMQQLFALMGKAVRIEKAEGQVQEGIVRGVFLGGAELITIDGVITVPFEEIVGIEAFGASAPASAAEDPLPDEAEGETGDMVLLREIRDGTKESLAKKLENPAFCKRAGLSAMQAEAVSERLAKLTGEWEKTGMRVVQRYRALLKTDAKPEILASLYMGVLEEGGTANRLAILELLRIYVRTEAYEDAIRLYRQYEEELGDAAYSHMQMYAAAIGYTAGAAALQTYLEAHPALVNFSTNRPYFEKLLKELQEERIKNALETLLDDGVFAAPNAFETEILAGNIHRARQMAANETEMRNMGYTQIGMIEEYLRQPQVEDMGEKALWQRACILQRLEGNRNRVVEMTLLEEGEEPAARAALVLLYAREKEYKKVMLLYKTLEEVGFDQKIAAVLAHNALGTPSQGEEIIDAHPELLADDSLREMLLSAPEGTYKAADVARTISDKAIPMDTINPFEKALIEGNGEEIEKYNRDARALLELGYTKAEIEKIMMSAGKPYPTQKNDLSAGRRLRLFLGGRGLLAVRYICRYATEQNTAEILSLMELGGLCAWGELFFEARRTYCEGNGACCAAYASMMLAHYGKEAALEKIAPLIGNIFDRTVLERIRTACLETNNTAIGDTVNEILDTYEPNAFEQAVISGVPLQTMLEDAEFMQQNGYSEEEISAILRRLKNLPKGNDEASIGVRLFFVQKNKNGLAERYMARHAAESAKTAHPMLKIYHETERFEEVVALYKKASKFFGENAPEHSLYLDALYETGNDAEFIEAYYKTAHGKAKRHVLMCAVCMLKTGDTRIDEVLTVLLERFVQTADKTMLHVLWTLLAQKEMYAWTARLLCKMFHDAVLGGTYESCLPVLEVAVPDAAAQGAVITCALEEGLPMALPAWWAARTEDQTLREVAENWYAEALEDVETYAKNTKQHVFAFLETLFPERRAALQEKKFMLYLEDPKGLAGAATVLEKLLAEKEYDRLQQLLPFIGDAASSDAMLPVLKQIFEEEVLCEEILTLLCSCLATPEAEKVYIFFGEHVDFSLYKALLGETVMVEIKNGFMTYAAAKGDEWAFRALYTFLCQCEDPDSTLLACFMMNNSRIWRSHESRAEFEVRCQKGSLTSPAEALSAAFSEVLTAPNPESAPAFLKKWHPFTNRRTDEALKTLSRLQCEGESAEVICSMAAAYQSASAWRRLVEIYSYKGTETVGNMYYAIAKYSPDMQDMQQVIAFAKKNDLPLLKVGVSLLRMQKERTVALSVKNGCKDLQALTGLGIEIPQEMAMHFLLVLDEVLSGNPAAHEEILPAGRAFAFACGMAREYVEIFTAHLLAAPQHLVALILEIYTKYPQEAALGMEMRQLLAENTADFPAKAFTLAVTEEPEKLQEKGEIRAAAEALLPLGGMMNVYKMTDYITTALTASDIEAVDVAAGAMRRLLPYFPEEGLYHECLYYFLSARGEKAEAAETYTALFNYLSKTWSSPNLFVHYVKRLFCGLFYLQARGEEISGAPKNQEELYAFFDKVNAAEECRAELSDFVHLTVMLRENAALYESLMYCGLTANWRSFISAFSPENMDVRQIGEIDTYISGIGRYNFLRSIAYTIVTDGTWEAIACFLSDDERAQVEAIDEVPYTVEERETAKRLTRCTLLDKTSMELWCDKVFAQLSPEQFGVFLPILRVMLLDSVTTEKLKRMPDAYMEAASNTVVRQKETVPEQVMCKAYRDFLRALGNLLFDRGLYKAVEPILWLLFDTDKAAAEHSAENRVSNVTHAVCRQRHKFCCLVNGDPETVENFKNATEYNKLINIFGVHFASSRARDIARIAPLMTTLQKKLCAAVFFTVTEDYTEFERLAADIQTENAEMGELLFRYGEWRFKKETDKSRCRLYLRDKVGNEANPIHFFSPSVHPSLRNIPIFELLDLGEATEQALANESQDSAAQDKNYMLETAFVRYALSHTANVKTGLAWREAMARFEAKPDLEAGAAVLRAEDFFSAAPAVLQPFFGRLAVLVYREARRQDSVSECMRYVPEIIMSLAPLSAVQPETANMLCHVLVDIFGALSSLAEYRKYFAGQERHLRDLLSAADSPQTCFLRENIDRYLKTAESATQIRALWEEDRKIEEIERLKAVAAQDAEALRAKARSELAEDVETAFAEEEEDLNANRILYSLVHMLEDEIEERKHTPLFRVVLDAAGISEGTPVTGFVENFGLESAESVVLTLRSGEESRTAYMETLYAAYRAPFAFLLPAEEVGTDISFALWISYTFEDKPYSKNLGSFSVKVLPRTEYAPNPLSEQPIEVEKIGDFIGRTSEIRDFEAEFYIKETDENGKVRRRPRNVKDVPAMVINGPKRVGKTSLLHKIQSIAEEVSPVWSCVYYDAGKVSSLRQIFVTAFAAEFAHKHKELDILNSEEYRRIEALVPKTGELDALMLAGFYRAFRDAFAPGQKLLYFIDEIEKGISVSSVQDLFNLLEHAIRNLSDVIGFVICGSDDLTGIIFDTAGKSQFFQLAKNFRVGCMPKEEYEELLDAFASRSGLRPDEEARQALWRLTNGQVFYTLRIFNTLVDIYRRPPLCGSRRNIHLYDVYDAFDKQKTDGGMFSGLEKTFENYGTGEHAVIETIASYAMAPGEGATRSLIEKKAGVQNVEEALMRLQARGFIFFAEGEYKFTSEMYRVVFGQYAPRELYFR